MNANLRAMIASRRAALAALDPSASYDYSHARLTAEIERLEQMADAQKTFERAGFKRQNPMYNTYRGMSLKSATYRRGGRGRSWQRAWWIDGPADAVRSTLEKAIGALAAWRPDV